jgi:hypothetical protein
MLVMKKIPIGNPVCPPFVWSAKKIFNALMSKCSISSHECIHNLADNNVMLDPVEENNSNQGNIEVQEDEVEIDVESPSMISVFDVANSLPSHDSDSHAHLNSLPRMVISSILSSKKAWRKEQVNEDGETDSSSTSQILEKISCDMQKSKRCQEEDMEYHHIQPEDWCIQLEEVWEEQWIQQLRIEDSNALFE